MNNMKIYFILNGRGEYFSEDIDGGGVQFLKSKADMTVYPSYEDVQFAIDIYKDWDRFAHETWRIYEIDLAKAIRIS